MSEARSAAERSNKTQPTAASVDDFLAGLTERRRSEATELITWMQEISGEDSTLWGPSIIGFGSTHYRYESGREGDMPTLGFSPRKASLTIYFSEGFDRYGDQLARLGKHRTSVSCLYLNKLADADPAVLREMLEASYRFHTAPSGPTTEPTPVTPLEAYLASIPVEARPCFDELRALIKELLPQAYEVHSYGIVGYKVDAKRARVFISGWKDHLGLYPLPKDPDLLAELAPYQHGKGTLWFPLDQPLPRDLITRTVQALTADAPPTAAGVTMAKPANVKALQTGSGIAWEDWVTWLDARNARTLDHAELAKLTLSRILEAGESKSPEWWAQGVAVAYEQHIGRRQPGQTCTGDFSVTVSKTLPGGMDEALERWSAYLDGRTEFDGVEIAEGPRSTATEKWRYWRATMTDGTALAVNFTTKSTGGKTTMAINHDKLPAAEDVERWRTFWKDLVKGLA